jgi:hypothetical protein
VLINNNSKKSSRNRSIIIDSLSNTLIAIITSEQFISLFELKSNKTLSIINKSDIMRLLFLTIIIILSNIYILP